MEGNIVTVLGDKQKKIKDKVFQVSHCFWSHDGYVKDEIGYLKRDPEDSSSAYADQMLIFETLGAGIVDNTLQGLHSTLFAYGEPGSGKSYTVMGTGANKGLLHMICEKLFAQIGLLRKEKDVFTYSVTFSMFEIYNEKVRDLLDDKPTDTQDLKVTQSDYGGFEVEDVSKRAKVVDDYDSVQLWISKGEAKRVEASHAMNFTSSRAHTISTLTYVRAEGEERKRKILTAKINLVDLAGSANLRQLDAKDERMKRETGQINRSLFYLREVLKALFEKKSKGTALKAQYSRSVLTKLLQDALGGNCKTIMLVTISPAPGSRESTSETLAYASKSKEIVTYPKENEIDEAKIEAQIKEKERQREKRLQAVKEELQKKRNGFMLNLSSGLIDQVFGLGMLFIIFTTTC